MAYRPGIMFYFTILDDLVDCSDEEIGKLFKAMMQYGQTGDITEFEDRSLRILWRTMMRYVDRDQERYDDIILQKKYAGWCSAQRNTLMKQGKKAGDIRLPSFEDWKKHYLSTADNDR